MSQTLQIINMIVLVIAIGFAMYSLYKSDRERKKKKVQNEDYRTVVNDFTGLGKEYDPHKWYFKMPDSALKHLEACFDGDERKVYTMRRAIELSIEHFAQEMQDDAECARIIEERVFSNPKPSKTFDIEEYKQYRQEREEFEGEVESFTQWKGRKDGGSSL
ncbi:MAG: hypothetical protein NT103_02660 [Campylobacterales bacterium]|nr:hypothetical protein [Campylobacterales bacterium]